MSFLSYFKKLKIILLFFLNDGLSENLHILKKVTKLFFQIYFQNLKVYQFIVHTLAK